MMIFKVNVGKEVLLDVRESSRALNDCPEYVNAQQLGCSRGREYKKVMMYCPCVVGQ